MTFLDDVKGFCCMEQSDSSAGLNDLHFIYPGTSDAKNHQRLT